MIDPTPLWAMKRIWLFLLLAVISCTSSRGSTFTVGRDATWFPLNLGGKTANVTAFSTALLQEIGREERLPFEIIDVSWDALFRGLRAKEYHAVLSSLPPNNENRQKFTFSSPFLLLGPVLVVQEGSPLSTVEDLKGKLVGTSQFDDSILILQKDPTIQIKLYANLVIAAEDLADGQIDALLMPNLEAHNLIPSRYKNVLKISSPPLSDKALRMITIKDSEEVIVNKFNRGLGELKVKSRYKALCEKFSVL